MPGAGKSTLGQALAAHLNWPLLDMDLLLPQQLGRSLSEIWQQAGGEAAYRALEREWILKLPRSAIPSVIVLGGGAGCDAQSMAHLKSIGTLIWLSAPISQLISRLQSSEDTHRPWLRSALTQDTLQRALTTRLQERIAYYSQAHLLISSAQGSPATWIQQIMTQLPHLPSTFMMHSRIRDSHIRILTPGTAPTLGEWISHYAEAFEGIALLYDAQLEARIHSQLAALFSRARVVTCPIPSGEATKSLTSLAALTGQLLTGGIHRGSLLIAIGGGSVLDVSGFAAATYMRGIQWISVPTTLLAMVDAAIGGKVAVNCADSAGHLIKNSLGAFYPPSAVLIDESYLTTLPARELSSGMAELIKIALIQDADLYEALRTTPLSDLIPRAIQLKVNIVAQDEQDHGLRQILNFGHTLGHAFEAAQSHLTHGEAVALGMIAETEFAIAQGQKALTPLIISLKETLSHFNLPTNWQPYAQAAIPHLNSDKKANHQTINLPTLKAAGKITQTQVKKANLKAFLKTQKQQ